YVAIRRLRGIDRLDRCHAVLDSSIVDQRSVERRAQRKTAELPAAGTVHGRRAASDIAASYEQTEHVVDAVTMHAFRCGLARRTAARLDAELVAFDAPLGIRSEGAEQLAAESEYALHARAFEHVALDRLEPALNAAGQRVVV